MTEDDRGQHLIIERTLTAPPETVWAMWTEAAHFAAWYGPSGASVTVATMDVRVGGTRLIQMEMATPDGPMQMWFTGTFVAVEPHRELVYTEALCDEKGTILTSEQTGLPADHPTTTEVRVELLAVDGGTAMVLTHTGIPADSPGATGWLMALDKLDARLSA